MMLYAEENDFGRVVPGCGWVGEGDCWVPVF